jgi:pantetheine-phosphate adenylyltransferase
VRVAVYPGSFDPVTFGHLDVLRRAAEVFDRVVIAVLENPRKAPLLDAQARIALLRSVVATEAAVLAERVEVAGFDGLTVEFCRARGARFLVRGLRAVSDIEAEMLLAHNNRRLAPEIDSVFFMTALEYGYVSSSLVREIAQFGGDVSGLVPRAAADALKRAFAEVG